MGTSIPFNRNARQVHARVWDAPMVPFGYEQLTPTAATALTVPPGASVALLQCDAQAVRFRDDGVNPTPTVGIKIPVDTLFWYTGDLEDVRFIQATGGAILNVSYYGDGDYDGTN